MNTNTAYKPFFSPKPHLVELLKSTPPVNIGIQSFLLHWTLEIEEKKKVHRYET